MDPINPQDDPALIAKLAAMTDDEFNAVVVRARGNDTNDVKELILRELNRPQRNPEPLTSDFRGVTR